MLGMNTVALVFFGCINVASVKQLLSQSGWAMALPVYYIALTAFVLLTICGVLYTVMGAVGLLILGGIL